VGLAVVLLLAACSTAPAKPAVEPVNPQAGQTQTQPAAPTNDDEAQVEQLATPEVEAVSASEQAILEAAWKAFDPLTASHKQENWFPADVRTVKGSEVTADFNGVKTSAPIDPAKNYTYLILQPTTETSASEPRIREAGILIDPAGPAVIGIRILEKGQ
jgi:hypothetical protein